MGRPWSSKREFKRFSGRLAELERSDFQSAILPFLRAIWPAAIATPASRSFDRMGADHLVWADEDPLPLVVQAKGFDAGTRVLGSGQVDPGIGPLDRRLRFAHRAFQEFFLADHLLHAEQEPEVALLMPEAVRDWMREVGALRGRS